MQHTISCKLGADTVKLRGRRWPHCGLRWSRLPACHEHNLPALAGRANVRQPTRERTRWLLRLKGNRGILAGGIVMRWCYAVAAALMVAIAILAGRTSVSVRATAPPAAQAAAQPATAAVPPIIPKTWIDELRDVGRPLLEAGKWAEAAECYGISAQQLAEDTHWAQYSRDRTRRFLNRRRTATPVKSSNSTFASSLSRTAVKRWK